MKKSVKLVGLLLIFIGSFFLHPIAYAAENDFGIVIDGAFSDWADKPITKLTTSGDDFNVKEGSLLADTKNIYFYLNMSESGVGYHDLQPAGYKLVIAGKTYWLTFSNTLASNDAIGTSKKISVSAWREDNGQNYSIPNGLIMETRQAVGDGYSDMIEFSIPYGDLGLDSTIVDEISLVISNKNLGDQEISTTGGSTGPFIIAGVGFLLGIGAWYLRKKKAAKVIRQ